MSDNEVVAVLVQFQGENISKTVINITQRQHLRHSTNLEFYPALKLSV